MKHRAKEIQQAFAIGLTLCMAAFGSAQDRYADVPEGHWAYKATSHLLDGHIFVVTGDAGKFLGIYPLNRYEFAMLLDRLYRFAVSEFTDMLSSFPLGRIGAAVDPGALLLLSDDLKAQLEEKVKKVDVSYGRAQVYGLQLGADRTTNQLSQIKRDLADVSARATSHPTTSSHSPNVFSAGEEAESPVWYSLGVGIGIVWKTTLPTLSAKSPQAVNGDSDPQSSAEPLLRLLVVKF